MPPETPASQSWSWKGTPNPSEKILAVKVKTELITLLNQPNREIQAFGDQPYKLPTTFAALAPEFNLSSLFIPVTDGVPPITDWYFIGETVGDEITEFYFFPPKTVAQSNTPYDIDERQGNHSWAMVVLEVAVFQDFNFPISANHIDSDGAGIVTAPTSYILANYIPPIQEGSRIITRKFLTALRPNIPHWKVPQPMPMDIQINGAARYFAETLHDDIVVQATRSGTKKYNQSTGATSDVGGVIGEQDFPATNFIDRRPFYLSDDPSRIEPFGLWNRVQVQVRPPKTLSIEEF